jgi:hypothetical protein
LVVRVVGVYLAAVQLVVFLMTTPVAAVQLLLDKLQEQDFGDSIVCDLE